MAIIKPNSLPVWDYEQTNMVQPDATRQAGGWQMHGDGTPEKPAYQHFNWWMNRVYQWVSYFDNLLSDFSANPAGGLCLLTFEPTSDQQLKMKALPNIGLLLPDGDYPTILEAWGDKNYGGTSTHFYLPDDRGLHYRVLDDGAGVDTGANTRLNRGDGTTGDKVGTLQNDQMPEHDHEYFSASRASSPTSGVGGASTTDNFGRNEQTGLAGTGIEVWIKNRYIWSGTYY